MQTLPFAEARAQLADALRSVEARHEPLLISRRGQVAGVLMSYEQYRQLDTGGVGLADRIQRWRAEYLGAAQSTATDDPFDQLRQTEPGRDFAW
jgi:prevent-host-death family protein